MIKVPRNFFSNLNAKQYREQLKLLPKVTNEKAQFYLMIGFTLGALIIFGIFAINPTLSTIVELKRQLSDLQFVKQKLETKTQNLSLLQQKYQNLTGEMPYVYAAIPRNPQIPKFTAQVNSLISKSNLTVRSLRTNGVEITPDKIAMNKKITAFVFNLEAEGKYEDMLNFVQTIARMDRLVTIELVSIAKDEKGDSLTLNLRGREYFMP